MDKASSYFGYMYWVSIFYCLPGYALFQNALRDAHAISLCNQVLITCSFVLTTNKIPMYCLVNGSQFGRNLREKMDLRPCRRKPTT